MVFGRGYEANSSGKGRATQVDMYSAWNVSLSKCVGRAGVDYERSVLYLMLEGERIERSGIERSFHVSKVIAVTFDDIVHIGWPLGQILVRITYKFYACARHWRRVELTFKG